MATSLWPGKGAYAHLCSCVERQACVCVCAHACAAMSAWSAYPACTVHACTPAWVTGAHHAHTHPVLSPPCAARPNSSRPSPSARPGERLSGDGGVSPKPDFPPSPLEGRGSPVPRGPHRGSYLAGQDAGDLVVQRAWGPGQVGVTVADALGAGQVEAGRAAGAPGQRGGLHGSWGARVEGQLPFPSGLPWLHLPRDDCASGCCAGHLSP